MLSQTVGYAITALGHLASSGGGPILVRDVAHATEIPSAYLSKIVNTLAKKGFVQTQRGIRGGVSLAHDPQGITLYDLCEALDDPLTQRRCMFGSATCTDERACPAHIFWIAQRERQLRFLKGTTLRDVAVFEASQAAKPTAPATAPTRRPHAAVDGSGHSASRAVER